MNNFKGSLILLLTAFIWGTAFVAQTSGADAIGTFTFNSFRAFVGAAFLALVIVVRNIARSRKNLEKAGAGITAVGRNAPVTWPVGAGVVCGIVLFAAMSFQQYGISRYPDGVAASGRAGFITATYVVMVSVAAFFMGKKQHWIIGVSVAGCIAGMYLLCMSGEISAIYIGDVFELAGAICFTCHILVIDKFSGADSIKMSCIQFLIVGIISAFVMMFTEEVTRQGIQKAFVAIIYAGVFSSGIAYTLQMIGQKYAQPAVASIVMSLESVFAALAGWIILGEILMPRELAGCILVFVSVILAQIPGMKRGKV